MNATFVDTSFLIALLRTKDEHHERALAWREAVAGELLTTEYILIELADACSTQPLRGRAAETIALLRTDPGVRIAAASTALLDEGLALFAGHVDKCWGLTDCLSFAVMRRNGVQDALTTDHHFEQAGFRALLRMPPPEIRK